MPPTYDYDCACGWAGALYVPIFDRDGMHCPRCYRHMHRLIAAPAVLTEKGGPDRFTADMLGIPVGELPERLKTK